MTSSLTKLAHIAKLTASRPALIEQARKEGSTWEEIAEALRMSRAGVIKLHKKA